ncbi:MAG: DNA-binding response regulator [Anaerolineaceae bacterium]|nr:MAG: DNA-binding response regulator [Anaerolineaceae bacterium]
MAKKVLLIDDDAELGKLVEVILRPVEVTIYQALCGLDGLRKAYQIHPDMIILDIMMPDMDGFDVCLRLRELTAVPILMLTARTKETDLIRGFKVGVDDFVKKPFNKNELEARVRALIRRTNFPDSVNNSYITSYQDSILEIDLTSQTVKLCGEIVELSPREYSFLACLIREQGKIVSHHELVREIWGGLYTNEPSMSSLYIHYIRTKLQDGEHGHHYIHTMWGRGYWFEPRKEE